MGEHKSYRVESRADWGTTNPGVLDRDQIKLGAILRIADAMEKMCVDRVRIEADLEWEKKRSARLYGDLTTERRRSAALRGVIKKMKRKA